MRPTQGEPVHYSLVLSDQVLDLNAIVGKTIKLVTTGRKACVECGRALKKTYQQGFCFPCTQTLAACDLCMVKPERCHYHLGTCREPSWGEEHCFQDHYIYLADTSGLKVGITRMSNVPTRWMDQGATQALPIARVKNRRMAGLLEVEIAKEMADKTNWRENLKGEGVRVDLIAERAQALDKILSIIDKLQAQFPEESFELLEEDILQFHYPVDVYPVKIVSLNFDKTPEIQGTLNGIKGQYLLLDTGVLNIRKFSGYEVSVEAF